MLSKIFIKGLRLYAYHGVLEQEHKIGAYFTIDIDITTDFLLAMDTDNLCETINYATVFTIIKQEMAISSYLLEHVAGRIARTIFSTFSSAQTIHLRITKENPPMGADCQGAGVDIIFTTPKDLYQNN